MLESWPRAEFGNNFSNFSSLGTISSIPTNKSNNEDLNAFKDEKNENDGYSPIFLFSDEQREALKVAFALDPYPSTSALDYLSQELKLDGKTIGNWFHNHRMRLKQVHGTENLLGGMEGQVFDPKKFKLLLNHRKLEMQVG